MKVFQQGGLGKTDSGCSVAAVMARVLIMFLQREFWGYRGSRGWYPDFHLWMAQFVTVLW